MTHLFVSKFFYNPYDSYTYSLANCNHYGSQKKAISKPTENPEMEKEKTPDLQWTDEMEAALFNAFLDQHNKGKSADGVEK